jgi:predicted RNA methylase
MARLAAQTKMGYYPTPGESLEYIRKKIAIDDSATILDPCCGEGVAVKIMADYGNCPTYAVELDTERAREAMENNVDNILCGSIYDVIIRPLACFSLLYLNPPYDNENGERMEFLFLKQAHRWLVSEGILVYLIPERLLAIEKVARWIKRRYKEIKIYRFTRDDYPVFKQVVLFGIKRDKEAEEYEDSSPSEPYSYIEDTEGDFKYTAPPGKPPEVFELKGITVEEIINYRETALKTIKNAINIRQDENTKITSPIFPLRKGHLVSLLMSGVLNGRLASDLDVVFKCFTERTSYQREEQDGDNQVKVITTKIYVSGIRVIEKGNWYDIA